MVAIDMGPGNTTGLHGSGEYVQECFQVFLAVNGRTVAIVSAQDDQIGVTLVQQDLHRAERTRVVVDGFLEVGHHEDAECTIGAEGEFGLVHGYSFLCGKLRCRHDGMPLKSKIPEFFNSGVFGGEGGIRTLVGVLAQTRFPVVRLRPAQPTFQTAHNAVIILKY